MERESAAGSRTAKQGRVPLFGRLDRLLLDFGAGHAKTMRILRMSYQVISLAIAVYFGVSMFKLIGVAGALAFFETAFAGMTLQVASPAFYNGTAAAVVLLLVAYGLLTAALLPAARILCDAAVLYGFFFSLTVPLYQFSEVVTPLAVVYAIWIVHRLVLGTVVFRYRKLACAVR